jgi:hypothetical protein
MLELLGLTLGIRDWLGLPLGKVKNVSLKIVSSLIVFPSACMLPANTAPSPSSSGMLAPAIFASSALKR